MTDLADHAHEIEERHRAAALAWHRDRNQRAVRPPPRPTCTDCGDLIPSLRLVAVPHATRCAHCQGIAERGRVV